MRPATASIRAALLPFAVSRVVVVGCVGVARIIATHVHASRHAVSSAHAGLLGWDASWYRRIAALGYGGAGRQSLRFFPLLPILTKGVAVVPGIGDGWALLLVANLGALAALALIHRLVLVETHDEAAAGRAPWLLALFPAAFVLVMGYAESLLLAAALATFLCLRTKRFMWAALPAILAGAARPVGLLLAAPALVEAAQGWASIGARARLARVAAVLAAPAGAAGYLVWSKVHDGSFLLPFREQLSAANRGGVADPFTTLYDDARDVVHGTHFGTALHAPWAIFLVFLVVVLFRKWPLSFGVYAAVTLVVALTAPNLTSLERYGLGCFPFTLALVSLTERRELRWGVLSVSTAMLVGYSILAFLGTYVP